MAGDGGGDGDAKCAMAAPRARHVAARGARVLWRRSAVKAAAARRGVAARRRARGVGRRRGHGHAAGEAAEVPWPGLNVAAVAAGGGESPPPPGGGGEGPGVSGRAMAVVSK